MQGLADGYFVAPATLASLIAGRSLAPVTTDHDAFAATEQAARERFGKLLAVSGSRTVDSFHRELGLLCWDKCGMSRSREGLEEALADVRALREAFWQDVRVLGDQRSLNQNLEHAGRVADFMEFAELMIGDALHREESCGGHFREEYQTEEGEALRNDDEYTYVAAWEHQGEGADARLQKEDLVYENVTPSTRSYK